MCYNLISMLQKHVDSHKRIPDLQKSTFYCTRGDCHKAFESRPKLKDHIKFHDNDLIKCYFCPWRGARDHDLVNHMNHHFQIRPFKCSFCVVSFYQATDRNLHETNLHEKIFNRYNCDKCQFKTHASWIYIRHKATAHR